MNEKEILNTLVNKYHEYLPDFTKTEIDRARFLLEFINLKEEELLLLINDNHICAPIIDKIIYNQYLIDKTEVLYRIKNLKYNKKYEFIPKYYLNNTFNNLKNIKDYYIGYTVSQSLCGSSFFLESEHIKIIPFSGIIGYVKFYSASFLKNNFLKKVAFKYNPNNVYVGLINLYDKDTIILKNNINITTDIWKK